MAIIDLEAFQRTPLRHDPCDFIVVPEFVRRDVLDDVNRDYPEISEPGNFPLEQLHYGAHFATLLEELASDETRAAFASKFDVDLSDLILQTTVRKYSEASDGAIHNDSRTKIVTALIYFNETWPHAGGRLRLLRSVKNIDDYAAEVTPERGILLAFRRSETSYHGFEPCEAERRSLQMYWVKPKRQSRDDRRPGSLKKRFKRLFKRS
jgi:hypothetical protein